MAMSEPSLLSLPDDLLLSCLARVSRSYYLSLSIVSKRFRSLLASPELYKVRSSLGKSESCLYVCLRSDFEYCWFTLCRKPDHQTQSNKSSGYVLARVPIPHSPPAVSSGLVAAGSNIYNISGISYVGPASKLSILDCRSHTWSGTPNLRENQSLSICASVAVDENIYVAQSYRDVDNFYYSKEVVKVFHTKTQNWNYVPITCKLQGKNFLGSACLDGKIYLKTEEEVASYDPKEGRWDFVEQAVVGVNMFKDYHCVIKNVLYSISGRMLKWYDSKQKMWRTLKGLEGLPKLPFMSDWVKLADYGGNMAVLWIKESCSEKMIWCAEIALERRKSSEIWGKVEWSGLVLTVPLTCNLTYKKKTCSLVKVLAVTV